jgi:hypothetical protein
MPSANNFQELLISVFRMIVCCQRRDPTDCRFIKLARLEGLSNRMAQFLRALIDVCLNLSLAPGVSSSGDIGA